jgi:hypothetical protein
MRGDTMKHYADIDIDTTSDFIPKNVFSDCVYASRVMNGELLKHPVGVHFQNIPVDPVTKLSAIPYDHISEHGYFKIDMLHISVLDSFTSKQDIKKLLKKEPNWNILLDSNHTHKLFQLNKHYELLKKVKPTSIMELADCIALIRPGKMILLNKYIANKSFIRPILYQKQSSSDYKKSHAVAYAHIVVLQLHLIQAGLL